MEKLYTIIIPCHNDCENAEKLATTLLGEVIVGHNGCNNRKFLEGITIEHPALERTAVYLPWSNKAKTINHLARTILTDYIVVFDADTEISEFAVLAFEREMKKGVPFGTGAQYMKDSKEKYLGSSINMYFNGPIWFSRTALLTSTPVPEDIVTEDTAYYEMLKEAGVAIKLVPDAVAVSKIDKNLKRSFKRSIRYNLGALQMMKIKNYQYAFGTGILMVLVLFFMDIAGFFRSPIPILITILIFGWSYILRKQLTKLIEKHEYAVFIISNLFYMSIAPFIATYYFIRKKTIW